MNLPSALNPAHICLNHDHCKKDPREAHRALVHQIGELERNSICCRRVEDGVQCGEEYNCICIADRTKYALKARSHGDEGQHIEGDVEQAAVNEDCGEGPVDCTGKERG